MDARSAHTYCGEQGSSPMNIFPRPKPRTDASSPPRPGGYRPIAASALWKQPWPRVDATVAILIGFIVTTFALSSDKITPYPSQLAGTAAVGVGASLLVGFLFEARSGLQNLVRADLMGIAAFYYLTLYEFLFRQTYFDEQMRFNDPTFKAIFAVMLGFAGIVIGRHFVPRGRQPFEGIMTREIPRPMLVLLFWVSFILGYLHMLVAVKFDLPLLLDYMTQPRFNQPWGRGKYGDLSTMVTEMLGLMLYFVPPLAGLMFARRERFSKVVIGTVLLGCAWTLFAAFCTGTRNLFGTYLVTFMIAFAFASPAEKRQQVIGVCLACATAMGLATSAMLEMRPVGFKRWLEGDYTVYVNRQSQSVFVDDNLLAIAKIASYFPDKHPYLGVELPYLAIVRPIPRVLWPGKPIGLSVSLEEDVFGTAGLTISSTFAGEGFMSGGLLGVSLFGLVLGGLGGLWNRMASPKNSELGILIYASGFFAVVITMRSVMTLTTALLTPAVGLLAGHFLLKGARRVLGRVGGGPKNRPPMPKAGPNIRPRA
jgi:oligosaccharide repeat unit polymerase